MSSEGKIRLFKIAAEINIGKDAIILFLQSKGFDIENKPSTLLTDEMANLVHDKFKKELKIAEKQREKVEKLKTSRKVAEAKQKAVETPVAEEPVIIDEKPKSEIKDEKAPVPEILKAEIVKEEKPKHEPSPVPEAKPEIKEVKVEKDKVTKEPVSEDKLEKKKTSAEAEAKKPTEEITEAHVSEKGDEQPKTDEIQVPKEEEKETHLVEITETVERKGKKRKKRKKVLEVEYEAGSAPKLKGLTIVGRINLEVEAELKAKKEKERKLKPGEQEEETDPDYYKSKLQKLKKKQKVKGKEKEILKGKEADKKKRRKKSIREMITEDEIDKAIKDTLSGIGETSQVSMRSKLRQRKRAEREEREQKKQEEIQKEANILRLSEFVTTSDLARLMNVGSNEIIIKCMKLGLMVSINQRLDKDTITLIADDYGMEVEFLDDKAAQILEVEEEESDDNLEPRSPIVTIMGHVDHGKTSLLDHIRKTNVVAGEAGGITQHIGAYRVELHEDKHITFLDTPGHEAFTAMRARGALVTDIVVLVVAADDSVMPQTVEAISHAQAANVPIVVAINKIDKQDSNPDRIKQQLADNGILVEDWGGKYQAVQISAKKGLNIEPLLEKILLEAEMLELKANSIRRAKGTIIESKMDKGLGAVATIIVQKGTLNIGDIFVSGSIFGRVRNMFDERGNKVKEAGPSMPVRVTGFDGLPEAGDILLVLDTEQEARAIANQRRQLRREQEFMQTRHVTLDDISKQIQLGGVKDLNLIIKGDVGGSVEALSDSLQKLSRDEVRINILHKGIGPINESDVMLALASGAIIIGFQISPTGQARKLAENNSVEIRLYNIIYDCINEVKLALEGLLSPDLKEDVTSTVEVRKIFKISRIGTIAGCYVLNGKISRSDKVRLLHDGLPVFTGTLDSLKRGKDDVKEADSGYECGIMLNGYNNISVGDIIESFKIVELKRTFN